MWHIKIVISQNSISLIFNWNSSLISASWTYCFDPQELTVSVISSLTMTWKESVAPNLKYPYSFMRVEQGYSRDAWLAEWYYFLWNVNLGNYSSWSVTWRFSMTREEVKLLTDICDFTTLFYVILRCEPSKWLELSVESDFAIWSFDSSSHNFTFFKHSF